MEEKNVDLRGFHRNFQFTELRNFLRLLYDCRVCKIKIRARVRILRMLAPPRRRTLSVLPLEQKASRLFLAHSRLRPHA